MSLSKFVAKMRFTYHVNAIEINNVLNQLHIRSDSKANAVGKYHFDEVLDCLERLGYDVNGYFDKNFSKHNEES